VKYPTAGENPASWAERDKRMKKKRTCEECRNFDWEYNYCKKKGKDEEAKAMKKGARACKDFVEGPFWDRLKRTPDDIRVYTGFISGWQRPKKPPRRLNR